MSEWRPRKWRKLHYDFATSKKLRRVGSDALALLATMIATAWWDDESSEGRMYDAEDVPTARADLYIGAQLSFAKGEKAFAELERRKVVAMVGGLVVLPRFREHQRGDSGERMKRHRARHCDGGRDGDVTSRVTDSRMQSAEADAENPSGSPRSPSKKTGPVKSKPTPGEASVANPEATASPALALPANDLPGEESPAMAAHTAVGKRRGKPRLARAAVDATFAEQAYSAFAEARIELTGRAPRTGLTDAMRDDLAKVIAAHAPTIDDWRAVVRVRLAKDLAGDRYGSLTWPSLTAPDNFERWLLDAQRKPARGRAEPSPRPTTAGVVDLKTYGREEPAT